MWMKEITGPLIAGTSDAATGPQPAIPVFRKQRLDFSSGLIERGMESE
jgi:hypothetical protein